MDAKTTLSILSRAGHGNAPEANAVRALVQAGDAGQQVALDSGPFGIVHMAPAAAAMAIARGMQRAVGHSCSRCNGGAL